MPAAFSTAAVGIGTVRFGPAAIAWSVPAPRGRWWLGAAVIAILYSLSTYLYFVPNMFKLWRQRDCAGRDRAAARPRRLHSIRSGTAELLAFFTALKAPSIAGYARGHLLLVVATNSGSFCARRSKERKS